MKLVLDIYCDNFLQLEAVQLSSEHVKWCVEQWWVLEGITGDIGGNYGSPDPGIITPGESHFNKSSAP